MTDTITFLLAFIGFVLLAVGAVLAASRVHLRLLSVPTALVVVAHVALVWGFRYKGAIEQATRNGYAGFVIFHLALAAILLAPGVPRGLARTLTLLAFVAVCVGANGAVFRYDVVAVYRIPVIATTVLGGLAVVVLGLWRRRRRE